MKRQQACNAKIHSAKAVDSADNSPKQYIVYK